jgi:hypothetical protein
VAPPGFPEEIDNTIRSTFVVCPGQMNYGYVRHLHPVGESVHLHAGGAYADGLEAARRAFFEQGRAPEDAVEIGAQRAWEAYGDFQPPDGSNKTRAAVADAIRYAFSKWPLGRDTYRPHKMEWRFRVSIPGLTHPDTQGPIYYVVRPDTYGDIGEVMTVEDDKTATALGASWEKNWHLDSQFTGYWWAGQQLGVLPIGGSNPVLIRGLSFLSQKFDEEEVPEGTLGAEPRDVFEGRGKNRVQVVKWFRRTYNRDASFGHAQSLTYRPQWMIERWFAQMVKDVKRMIHAYLNDEWDLALHKGACAAYGGCPYALLCGSEHPEQWMGNYVVRKWNPLAVI